MPFSEFHEKYDDNLVSFTNVPMKTAHSAENRLSIYRLRNQYLLKQSFQFVQK